MTTPVNPSIRRIVTGHDEQGKAIVEIDDQLSAGPDPLRIARPFAYRKRDMLAVGVGCRAATTLAAFDLALDQVGCPDHAARG